MKKLIELGVAIDTAICAVNEYDGEYDIEREKRIRNTFMALSNIDAAPMVHGRWIDIDSETYTWKIRCNKCGHERSMMSTGQIYPMYCENCGARMNGKDTERSVTTNGEKFEKIFGFSPYMKFRSYENMKQWIESEYGG